MVVSILTNVFNKLYDFNSRSYFSFDSKVSKMNGITKSLSINYTIERMSSSDKGHES